MSNFSYSNLIVKRQQSALHITFNCPETRNALSAELMSDITHLLDTVADDITIRALVFQGSDHTFCSGGNIKNFQSDIQASHNLDQVASANRQFGHFISKVNQQPQVVIMLIEGAAFGGGLGLACASDITIVTKDSKFRLSETSLGIIPAQILPFVTQRIGLTHSRRIMLTGAKFNGAEALRLGIAHQLASDENDMQQQCQQLLDDIARCAPHANRATKSLLFKSLEVNNDDIFDIAAQTFAKRMMSDEGREGVTAFIEKRPANWNQ